MQKSKKTVILNTGGFSRSFYQHIIKSHLGDIYFLSIDELINIDNTSQYTFSIVIVADWNFDEFKKKLMSNGFLDITQYGTYLLSLPLPLKLQLNPTHLGKYVAIPLSSNKGYRKPYNQIVKSVINAGFTPILFSQIELNDPLESNFIFIKLSDNFEIYYYLKQSELVISDANLLIAPMKVLQQPKLYIPHGFLGIFERNIELNLPIVDICKNHSDKILEPFTHAFLPSKDVFNFLDAIAQAAERKSKITLIPGGYVNLDMAIEACSQNIQNRDSILYCPGSIPENNLHSELPMSFPVHSQQIISRLLDTFPNYKIIFRHHPSAINDPEAKKTIDNIIKYFQHYNNFVYDENTTHKESFSKSLLMISDSSTSSFTFALSHLKPVVYFLPFSPNTTILINKKVFNSIKQNVGEFVFNSFDDLINKTYIALEENKKIEKTLINYRQKHFYNIGAVSEYLSFTIKNIIAKKTHREWKTI